MKVIAIKQGYFGKLRAPDEVFDVPEGAKASWFTPVDKKGAAEGKGDAKPSDGLKVDEIKAAKEKLMNSAQKLFSKVYEQAQAAQGAAGAQGQAGPQAGQSASQAGYGDDVVDGDYKEV